MLKRVHLCADCGRSAHLSDQALCLITPAWPVFSLNPVVALLAPPHSLSLAGMSAVGTRCWLLEGHGRIWGQALESDGGYRRLGWCCQELEPDRSQGQQLVGWWTPLQPLGQAQCVSPKKPMADQVNEMSDGLHVGGWSGATVTARVPGAGR